MKPGAHILAAAGLFLWAAGILAPAVSADPFAENDGSVTRSSGEVEANLEGPAEPRYASRGHSATKPLGNSQWPFVTQALRRPPYPSRLYERRNEFALALRFGYPFGFAFGEPGAPWVGELPLNDRARPYVPGYVQPPFVYNSWRSDPRLQRAPRHHHSWPHPPRLRHQ